MNGCEINQCRWWDGEKCTDPVEYVNKQGESVCSCRDDAITYDEYVENFMDNYNKNTMIKNYRDIKTFEDACKDQDINPDYVFSSNDSPDEIAYKKLKVVIKAINQGWIPDWNNIDQQIKWWPWFDLSSEFGFSFLSYFCAYTHSGIGSRFCFESGEKTVYTAKQFIELYKELLT